MSNDSNNASSSTGTTDELDLWAQSRLALLETIAQQLRVTYEAGQRTATAAASGPAAASQADAEPLRAALAGSGEAMRDFARASLQGYEQLLRVADGQFNRWRKEMEDAPRKEALSVKLVGLRGSVALGRFVVDNPYTVPAHVTFSEPKLISSDGLRRLAADVLFSRCDTAPPAAGADSLVAARSKGRFRVAVPLDSSVATGRYRGEAQAWMDERTIGRVAIELAVGTPLFSTDITLITKTGQPRVYAQSFAVPNPTAHAAPLHFAPASTFVSDSGIALVVKEFKLVCASAKAPVPPGQNTTGSATVMLAASPPSGSYRSTSVICADDEPIGELTLRIVVP